MTKGEEDLLYSVHGQHAALEAAVIAMLKSHPSAQKFAPMLRESADKHDKIVATLGLASGVPVHDAFVRGYRTAMDKLLANIDC